MFTIYGPGFTDPIRLEKLLQRPNVAKLEATAATQGIQSTDIPAKESVMSKSKYDGHAQHGSSEKSTSNTSSTLLKAEQIMMKPVLTVRPEMPAMEAWKMLDTYGFRHLPVLSEQAELLGMLSERDLMRCRCSDEQGCLHCHPEKMTANVGDVMQREVITAHLATDVRSITKVLLESHIGAMPIVEDKQLLGMITRSDILRAILHNSHLNVWM